MRPTRSSQTYAASWLEVKYIWTLWGNNHYTLHTLSTVQFLSQTPSPNCLSRQSLSEHPNKEECQFHTNFSLLATAGNFDLMDKTFRAKFPLTDHNRGQILAKFQSTIEIVPPWWPLHWLCLCVPPVHADSPETADSTPEQHYPQSLTQAVHLSFCTKPLSVL